MVVSIFLLSKNGATLQHKKITVLDTIWGKVIQDDYRWMEDLKDQRMIDWLKESSEYTNKQMDLIPGQDKLIAEFQSMDKLQTAVFSPLGKVNGKYLYTKRLPGEQVRKLYYSPENSNKEILLFDPQQYIKGKTFNYSAQMNNDGSIVLLNLSEAGSEIGDIRFIDVKSGKLLPDIIPHSTGIFSESNKNEVMYWDFGTYDVHDFKARMGMPYKLHVLGKPINSDITLVSSAKNTELKIPENVRPWIGTFKNSDFMILSLLSVENDQQTYYAKVSELKNNKINWKTLSVKEDEIKRFYVNGNDLYFVTSKGNSKHKFLKTSFLNPEFSKAQLITEGNGDWNLPADMISQTKDYIAFTKTKNDVESKVEIYEMKTGKISNLPNTLPGNIFTFSFGSENAEDNEIILLNSGWNVPINFYGVNLENKKIQSTILTTSFNYPNLENFVYEEIEIPSHDGVMVPLSIMYDKTKLKKDGSNILRMSGYGSYGFGSVPAFSHNRIPLMQRGVVFAVAHVRGGGEKGNDWYLDGKKTNKPNTWKDFNACAEWLINNKYTSAAKLGITGASAGGILIGRAVTSRPDLYRVAIPKVGCMNALRMEYEPNGPINIPEFGTVTIEEEFYVLLEMDAFHHIEKGVKYPAQLITTGFNDPRVASNNPAKYAAKMQAENGSNNPIFLDVDYKAGHSGGSTLLEQHKQLAREYAFLLWQTGHPEFQPK